jgi:uncharacterized membrane-anchored protein YhcB (DUF1043 family)
MFGFDDISAGLGSVLGAGLGYLGTQDTNTASAQIAQQSTEASMAEAQRNRDFQEKMSNTAYQRQVEDMKSAGLNPMLAYMKGGGASTPAGSTGQVTSAQYTSPVSGAVSARLTSAQAKKTEAEVPNVELQSKKVGQEIDNLKTDNDKTKAFIDNIKQEYQNLVKQGLNLTEVGNQIRKNIDLMSAQIKNFGQLTSSGYYQEQINKLEAQLRGYDVEAAKGAGNFGREYNQFKPLIDLLRSFIRR